MILTAKPGRLKPSHILLTICTFAADLYDRLPAERVAAQVDHPTSRHGRRRRVVDAVHLEDDLTVVGQRDAIAVRQRQRPARVQQSVEVFCPDWIDRPVKHQPRVFTFCISNTATAGLHRNETSDTDTGLRRLSEFRPLSPRASNLKAKYGKFVV